MGKSKKKRSIIRFTVLFAIVCAIGYTIYANAASEQGAVKVGEPATNFALVDLEQERFELGQKKAKVYSLTFGARSVSRASGKCLTLKMHMSNTKTKLK